jgi:hypothetical protein
LVNEKKNFDRGEFVLNIDRWVSEPTEEKSPYLLTNIKNQQNITENTAENTAKTRKK